MPGNFRHFLFHHFCYLVKRNLKINLLHKSEKYTSAGLFHFLIQINLRRTEPLDRLQTKIYIHRSNTQRYFSRLFSRHLVTLVTTVDTITTN